MKEIDEESRPYWIKELMPKKKLNSGVSPWSEVSYSQSSIKAFTLPRLKGSEQKRIKNNLAIHYYITGSSFRKIEEQHLIEAFKIARRDVQLPGRKQLAGPILDRFYERVKAETDKALTASDAIGCLTSDASSNVKNESIISSEEQKNRRKVVERSWVCVAICDENVVTNLHKSIGILEPIEVGVKAFQNDQISLSMVHKHFALSMPESYENMICLSNEERSYIWNIVKERLCFVYVDAIGIAYLLDPVMIGDGILDKHKFQAEDALLDCISQGISITDFSSFIVETALWKFRLIDAPSGAAFETCALSTSLSDVTLAETTIAGARRAINSSAAVIENCLGPDK
ncbi:hypothetical protein PsorP6_014903 [Peronosclerospora sorghi]|uniref:Uncharacterized protein n=1 Tax=Peronosclerospora sorghi TaxID=230839 RepID=A0ACC0VU57_9STRA|nr:hypothetical protein PsorP6_014903 [Peronosclerospora sorghi]